MKNYKKILLLGNSINRCFDGKSWEEFLKEIALDPNDSYLNDKTVPMAYQAVLLTKDNVSENIKKSISTLNHAITNDEMREMYQDILKIGFDDILTTNYGYELESVAFGVDNITKYQLKKHLLFNPNKRDHDFNIYDHYAFNTDGIKNNIWHIHGEVRKHSSVVLGQYYYINLIHRIKNVLDARGHKYLALQNKGKELDGNGKSWIDAFILSDVYIVGFGLDLCETDLWWLVNRKQREKANHGKIFFYDIRLENEESSTKKNNDLRNDLLRLFIDNDEDDDGYKGEIVSYYCETNEDRKEKLKEIIKEISEKINKKEKNHV